LHVLTARPRLFYCVARGCDALSVRLRDQMAPSSSRLIQYDNSFAFLFFLSIILCLFTVYRNTNYTNYWVRVIRRRAPYLASQRNVFVSRGPSSCPTVLSAVSGGAPHLSPPPVSHFKPPVRRFGSDASLTRSSAAGLLYYDVSVSACGDQKQSQRWH